MTYHCDHCDRTFDSTQKLGLHKRYAHGVAGKSAGNNRNRTIMLTKMDHELIAWAQEHLGITPSELIRAAVRAYIYHLQAVTRARE